MSGFAPSLRSFALHALPALLLAAASNTAMAQGVAPALATTSGSGAPSYSYADRVASTLLAGGMSRLAAVSAQQGGQALSRWAPPTAPEAIVNAQRMSGFRDKLPGWQLQGIRLTLAEPEIAYRQPDLMPAFMRGLTEAPATLSVQPAATPQPFARPQLASSMMLARAPRSGQPDLFGSVAMAVSHTPLDGKWAGISQPLARSGLWSGVIQAARAAGGQRQVEMINSWVNQRLRFVDDRGDSWASASQSLLRGSGDCEDYAIAKMKLLEATGFDRRAMFLVIARDLVRQADHAVLAVRIDDRLMILDNMTDRVLPSASVSDYRPIMSFNAYGRWTHGYRVTTPQKVQFAAR